MRSILFAIPVQQRFDLGPLGVWPLFGPGLLLVAWCLFGAITAGLWWRSRHAQPSPVPVSPAITWLVVALLIWRLPDFVQTIPLYGYGTMLFLGFLVAGHLAAVRFIRGGGQGEWAWDVGMWVLAGGILGARLMYILEFPREFFVPGRSLGATLFSLINLSDGGLVFYGAAIPGPLGFFLYCRSKGIRGLVLADIAITSVFLGMAFGRLGCLMNGCCFGGVCDLPWAVTFPANSLPFVKEVEQGYLSSQAARSLPIHPTQVYDACSAALMALLTWAYYPYRRFNGEVLALGWMVYPCLRFAVEFLRADEGGWQGTPLTIAQWVSLVLFATGLAFYAYITRRGEPADCRFTG